MSINFYHNAKDLERIISRCHQMEKFFKDTRTIFDKLSPFYGFGNNNCTKLQPYMQYFIVSNSIEEGFDGLGGTQNC